jgi:hypothetical protein
VGEHAGLRLQPVDLLAQLARPLALGAPGALDALEDGALVAGGVLQPPALLGERLPRGAVLLSLSRQLGLSGLAPQAGAPPALRRRDGGEQQRGSEAAEVVARGLRGSESTQAR